MVREVIYADDVTLINPTSSGTNLALNAVHKAGTFDAFKFKALKCKVMGVEDSDPTVFRLGGEVVKRTSTGVLLGAVVKADGIFVLEHVNRRAKMIKGAIKRLRRWRSIGVPFQIIFRKLFKAKILLRFTYAFSLFPSSELEEVYPIISNIFDKALSNAFGWSKPKGAKPHSGIWSVICGFPPVHAFLRQEKLKLAARLKVACHRAGNIFRNMLELDKGSFETDTLVAVNEWLLYKHWNSLNLNTLSAFRKKVERIAKKCWPMELPKDGLLGWLHHNHSVYSGNVPSWADWSWPDSGKYRMGDFQSHFYFLLIGQHPAWGNRAICRRAECKSKNYGTIYNHHFFDCENYIKNRVFFCHTARRLFKDSQVKLLPLYILENILLEPCSMWIGLIDVNLFNLGLRIEMIHEFHRICTVASVLSWGRFYAISQFGEVKRDFSI